MTSVLHSFISGWGRAARLWPVVLLLYAVDAAFALVLAVAPTSQLASAFSYSAMAPALVAPPSLELLVELLTNTDLGGFPWLLYLLVPLLSVVVTTFLRGGVLEELAREPGKLHWMEFFAACARHFPRLLILLFFLPPGLLAIGLVFLVAQAAVGLLPAALALAIRPALLALLVMLLLAAMDYARISLVLDPARPLLRHVGRGFSFVFARFPQVALLAIAFWIVTSLLAALFPVLLGPWSPVTGFLPALLIQQTSAILASLQRVAMLGGETRLFAQERSSRLES